MPNPTREVQKRNAELKLNDLLEGRIRHSDLGKRDVEAVVDFLLAGFAKSPGENTILLRRLKRASRLVFGAFLKKLSRRIYDSGMRLEEAGCTLEVAAQVMRNMVRELVVLRQVKAEEFDSRVRSLLPPELRREFAQEMGFWRRFRPSEGSKRRVA